MNHLRNQPEYQQLLGAIPLHRPLRFRTLILLRWAAIAGQAAAILGAEMLGIELPLVPCLLAVLSAACLNAMLMWRQRTGGTRSRQALAQFFFDVAQISTLLALTGGLSNPFAMLTLAPVTIAATTLPRLHVVALGAFTIIAITLSGLFAYPLAVAGEAVLQPHPLLLFGHWIAIMVGVIFFATYAYRVTADFAATADALFVTQVALAREQRLQNLGGVIAATAHEMGTPLATIQLIASELQDELGSEDDLAPDLAQLHKSAKRCGEILHTMGQAGKDDLLMRSARIDVILEEASAPHKDRGVSIEISASGPDIQRDPAILHGLRNLIENAVDHATSNVTVSSHAKDDHLIVAVEDDGLGFPTALLGRLGDPFLTGRSRDRRKAVRRAGYEGMGLGLFIAKTLLERSGARLNFSNGSSGARAVISWPLAKIASDSRASLGANPRNYI